MSRTGHDRPRAPQRPAAVMAFDFARGATTGRHSHAYGQLVHAASGLLRVVTDVGAWTVPPGRAVWIPASLAHDVEAITSATMRTLYVVPEALPHAPRAPRVVPAAPLLRELLLEALRRPRPYPLGGADERLFRVLLDSVDFRTKMPLHLPRPSSAPARAVAGMLERDPADRRTLAALTRDLSVSSRTIARAFVRETRMPFAAWRTQLRLMRALELLALGRSVARVAAAVGYASDSAFVATFHRHLGTTPARWFEDPAMTRGERVAAATRPPRSSSRGR